MSTHPQVTRNESGLVLVRPDGSKRLMTWWEKFRFQWFWVLPMALAFAGCVKEEDGRTYTLTCETDAFGKALVIFQSSGTRITHYTRSGDWRIRGAANGAEVWYMQQPGTTCRAEPQS